MTHPPDKAYTGWKQRLGLAAGICLVSFSGALLLASAFPDAYEAQVTLRPNIADSPDKKALWENAALYERAARSLAEAYPEQAEILANDPASQVSVKQSRQGETVRLAVRANDAAYARAAVKAILKQVNRPGKQVVASPDTGASKALQAELDKVEAEIRQFEANTPAENASTHPDKPTKDQAKRQAYQAELQAVRQSLAAIETRLRMTPRRLVVMTTDHRMQPLQQHSGDIPAKGGGKHRPPLPPLPDNLTLDDPLPGQNKTDNLIPVSDKARVPLPPPRSRQSQSRPNPKYLALARQRDTLKQEQVRLSRLISQLPAASPARPETAKPSLPKALLDKASALREEIARLQELPKTVIFRPAYRLIQPPNVQPVPNPDLPVPVTNTDMLAIGGSVGALLGLVTLTRNGPPRNAARASQAHRSPAEPELPVLARLNFQKSDRVEPESLLLFFRQVARLSAAGQLTTLTLLYPEEALDPERNRIPPARISLQLAQHLSEHGVRILFYDALPSPLHPERVGFLGQTVSGWPGLVRYSHPRLPNLHLLKDDKSRPAEWVADYLGAAGSAGQYDLVLIQAGPIPESIPEFPFLSLSDGLVYLQPESAGPESVLGDITSTLDWNRQDGVLQGRILFSTGEAAPDDEHQRSGRFS